MKREENFAKCEGEGGGGKRKGEAEGDEQKQQITRDASDHRGRGQKNAAHQAVSHPSVYTQVLIIIYIKKKLKSSDTHRKQLSTKRQVGSAINGVNDIKKKKKKEGTGTKAD